MAQFSLLTLNSFGLPFFVAWRRLPRLVRELHRHSTSLICLQEIQQNAYLPLVMRGLRGYPHFAFHPNRFAPRGGLLTASRLALEHAGFASYRNQGPWLSATFGDRFLDKGLLFAHLRVGRRPLIVVNTHLNVNYSGNWSRTNYFARIAHEQIQQLAEWVRAQPPEVLMIVCGDFNFPRASFLYEELLAASGLTDPLMDDPRPTYRPFSIAPARWALPIDFILIRVPPGLGVSVTADILAIEDTRTPRVRQRFLTDHCALTLELVWNDDASL